MRYVVTLALSVLGMAWLAPATAYDFSWAGVDVTINTRLTVGTAVRLSERDPDLISKLNNNPNLCPDDCLDLGGENGNPVPNQTLVDAPGGFFSANGDNGNLNYDQGDFIAGQVRLEPDMTVQWGDITGKLSALAFYDAVNSRKEEFHPDNFQDIQPSDPDDPATAWQPRSTRFSDGTIKRIGHDVDVLEGFVSVPFSLFEKRFTFTLGEQRVHWGEALFNVLGSLDVLNPLNENRLHFPGAEIAAVFEPVGMAVLSTQFTPNLGLELIYQYDWERAEPYASGGFFNFLEAAGGADTINISLGQLSEDPDRIGTFTNDLARMATATTATGVLLPENYGFPKESGQYGARFNWFAENFNGGTEFSFYYLNYHSRLPSASVFAADESCTRRAADIPAPGSGDIPGLEPLLAILEQNIIENVPAELVAGIPLNSINANALTIAIACGGFNGTGPLATALQTTFGPLSPNGPSEPAPIDTIRPFLDYPEDIHLFGTSFNTNLGLFALAGEYAYRPNQPLAVQPSDVVFAALQPAFAEEDVNVAVGILPGARNAVPDYVQTRYRNDPVEPNELIRGFERFDVHTADFTALRVFGPNNLFRAEQIIVLGEFGMTYVPDLTDPQTLPIASLDLGGGTHPSPGADGTGRPGGEPDPRSFNPTQQTRNYPTKFSAGFNLLARLEYNNVFWGLSFNPIIVALYDIEGIAPQPIQNYVDGRLQTLIGTDVRFNRSLSGQLLFETYAGGKFNNLRDRDNVALSLSYDF